MNPSLQLKDLEIWVHLGCSAEEQVQPQPVLFNLEIHFCGPIKACESDQLADAVDYVALFNVIREVSESKSFHLIEHLNFRVVENIVSYLKANKFEADIKLSVKKIRVPVEQLKSGVIFTCEAKASF